MNRKKPKKIVFVCTGNTCRSPMAEVLLRKILKDLKLTGLEVCSAGIKATVGAPMNEKSAQTLMDKGFAVDSFSAKQIDETTFKESLAIVCMTDSQRDLLMEMRWKVLREAGEEEIENNVYSFSELTGYEILDPYGKDIDCYRYVFELLSGGMSALTEKLLPPDVRKKYVEKPKAPRKPRAASSTTKKKTPAKKTTKKTTKTGAKTTSPRKKKTAAKKTAKTNGKSSANA